MQMSNMSGVDVRGFGNKVFICVTHEINYILSVKLRGTIPLTNFVTVYAFFQKLQHIGEK